MKITALATAMVLGAACLPMSACTQNDAIRTADSAPSCAQAEGVMVALEHGRTRAIDQAVGLMACYDGSHAERVDVALGRLIARQPAAVFKAMHDHQLDSDLIGSIARTQPWKLVDKPCRFAVELKHRLAAIDALQQFPRETKAARSHVAAFVPIVAEDCKSNNARNNHPKRDDQRRS